ncbi:uncharacterized protein BDR25DRAFT_304130 [Lindgomyces ingoldianus]|uniref:Uncharacterized protein n=1 Tax=Lindgomyces ingoldianus TaxID=673940 RepID=A0ACB6QT86_9PLEO|nr:uncharacterized protein BDR25DRAFT_304130 [Lindgomyces ingoldianus]KAF2470188.1 hypothetical protein BDR25DRAFT_304130 [Lindgomyces ingoldianus]
MPHTTPPKSRIIEEVQSSLPLPEQPPVTSDWNSADACTVNVSAGGRQDDLSHAGLGGDTLREPATATSGVRTTGEAWKTNAAAEAGRQAHDDLSGIPNDAVTRDAKNKPGLADTTSPDHGYPQKSNPSSGLQK